VKRALVGLNTRRLAAVVTGGKLFDREAL